MTFINSFLYNLGGGGQDRCYYRLVDQALRLGRAGGHNILCKRIEYFFNSWNSLLRPLSVSLYIWKKVSSPSPVPLFPHYTCPCTWRQNPLSYLYPSGCYNIAGFCFLFANFKYGPVPDTCSYFQSAVFWISRFPVETQKIVVDTEYFWEKNSHPFRQL